MFSTLILRTSSSSSIMVLSALKAAERTSIDSSVKEARKLKMGETRENTKGSLVSRHIFLSYHSITSGGVSFVAPGSPGFFSHSLTNLLRQASFFPFETFASPVRVSTNGQSSPERRWSKSLGSTTSTSPSSYNSSTRDAGS